MNTKVISLLVLLSLAAFTAQFSKAALPTAAAQGSGRAQSASFDGVVEAVRQTVMAAQVAGAIVELNVRAGDQVKAGQVLAKIDARAADQSATASQAQVQAARASLDVAAKDFARQKLLFEKQFISRAALDQAEAIYKAAASQVAAQIAQAGAARSQSDFYVLRAPYAGIAADVPVVLGDMALPGRAIVTIYDPSAMRVTASIPQTVALAATLQQAAKVELAGVDAAKKWLAPVKVTVLPTVDPNSHTLQVRLDLPADARQAVPGMFARAWLPVQGATGSDGKAASRVFVPAQAIVRRGEMTGVYVLDAAGKPVLRQVRLGRASEGAIEVLSGVSAGEPVVTDPQAAARIR